MGAYGARYNKNMNNDNPNPCGCGDCKPVCTTCGRPWVVCKGECGCKKPCCNKVNFCEYGRRAKGCIRNIEPSCPMAAVIPSVVVDDVSGLKNLADCFVHVTSINTTFYIDDKHRMMVTWAGPVEYDNYDIANNPNGLRSQAVIDFANDGGAYYNAVGDYKEFSFGEGGGGGGTDTTIHLRVDDPSGWTWEPTLLGPSISTFVTMMCDGTTDATFTNIDTKETLTIADVFALLDDGAKIDFADVPFGNSMDMEGFEFSTMGPLTLEPKQTLNAELSQTVIEAFAGSATGLAGVAGGALILTPFAWGIAKIAATDEDPIYLFTTQSAVSEQQ